MYTPVTIPFTPPRQQPIQQTQVQYRQGNKPLDISQFQFQKQSEQYPISGQSLMPLYGRIKDMGYSVTTVPSTDMVSAAKQNDPYYNPKDWGGQPSQALTSPSTKKIILNTDSSKNWGYIVPREYSHAEVATKNLYVEQDKLFPDSEARADAYANYWNDPVRYAKEHPAQAAWFQKNFVTPPKVVKVISRKK